MKRVYISLSLLMLLTGLSFFGFRILVANKDTKTVSLKTIVSKPTNTPKSSGSNTPLWSVSISDYDFPLRAYIQKIELDKELLLIPNFSEKADAQTLAQKHDCAIAINGGFYTKTAKPLGLLAIKDRIYGNEIESNLVTGFFWQDMNGTRNIDYESPENEVSFILQSGPIFSLPQKVSTSIVKDKPARRSLLAQDKDRALYAIVLYDPENQFRGPKLADIPVILSRNDIRKKVILQKALNLDGGSASFFYQKNHKQKIVLSELLPVGSLFCVREN